MGGGRSHRFRVEDPDPHGAALKVLTNEKRGGLGVVFFDRSPFQLLSLKFSNKSVQALFFERPKTTQRTLFLLFANNNCFQITLKCRKCKKSEKLASHVANSNIAIDTLLTLQISEGIIALIEKIYYEVPILGVFSNTVSGGIYNSVVSIKCMM